MEVLKKDTSEILKKFNNESVGNIIPIPITTKILEKNGFNEMPYNTKISTYRYTKSRNWIEEIDIYIHMFSIPKITVYQQDSLVIHNLQIQYVHQLQHILRVYGIDDLANNFKI